MELQNLLRLREALRAYAEGEEYVDFPDEGEEYVDLPDEILDTVQALLEEALESEDEEEVDALLEAALTLLEALEEGGAILIGEEVKNTFGGSHDAESQG